MSSVRIAEEPLQAYNLTVADYHTYFIKGEKGSSGVWVHNDCLWPQLPANTTAKKIIDGQEVYSFSDRGRPVTVAKNTSGNAYYREVNIVGGKVVVVDANKPDVIRLPNGATKHPDTGQFISDPTRRSSQTTNNDKYKWIEKYQNPDAQPGFIPNSIKEYSNNNYFVREQRWQAPQNGTKLEYRVYQQQIDPNAKPLIKNGDMRTNLQLMQAGRAPYVLKNGKYEQLQLHHAQQDGRGALFELSAQSHLHLTNQTGRKAVHPYWPEAHPKFPVPEDRSIFGNDQTAYWIERAKQYPGEK